MNVTGYLSSGYPFEQDEFTSETDPYIGRTVNFVAVFLRCVSIMVFGLLLFIPTAPTSQFCVYFSNTFV